MTPTITLRHEPTTLRRPRAARRLPVMPKPVGDTRDPRLAELLLLEDASSLPAPGNIPSAAATSPPCARAGAFDMGAVLAMLAEYFEKLHHRFDTLDRHAGDLMFLQLCSQDLLVGKRREFSRATRGIIVRVLGAEPYKGRCPCCLQERVLAERARPAPGAEFDHFFHASLNQPEHGWLICTPCHHELTYDGYLARFRRMEAFRGFQAAILQRRRAQRRPDVVHVVEP